MHAALFVLSFQHLIAVVLAYLTGDWQSWSSCCPALHFTHEQTEPGRMAQGHHGVDGRARVTTQGSWLQVTTPSAFHSYDCLPKGICPEVSPLNSLISFKIPTSRCSFGLRQHSLKYVHLMLYKAKGVWGQKGLRKLAKICFPFYIHSVWYGS